MWNLPIGVDIEDISRFENKSKEFLDRIYTEKEQAYCLSKTLPAKHLAVRFCAKEAVIKALTPLGIKIAEYKKIEIIHDANKCPQVNLLKKINKNLEFQISLSHDKTKAIAFVTVQELK